jgi:hypothetical protein
VVVGIGPEGKCIDSCYVSAMFYHLHIFPHEKAGPGRA